MGVTKIEWTDCTWNPLRALRLASGKVGWHCEKVSAGCANCYAETFNGRMLPNGGTGLYYDKSRRREIETFLDEEMLSLPLRWKKPRKIFVCSMTDLFGKWVATEQIDQVFAAMALSPHHSFQVLTKRPERMLSYLSGRAHPDRHQRVVDAMQTPDWLPRGRSFIRFPKAWPLENVWLGVSVEDQKTADERIPLLLETPAAVRFVSYEPALGPTSFVQWMHDSNCLADDGAPCSCVEPREVGIDWLIVGGESGPGARPFDIQWARSAIAKCKAAGVPCFVKQLGAKPFDSSIAVKVQGPPEFFMPDSPFNRREVLARVLTSNMLKLKSSKGGDPSEWPMDLRVRQFPT